MLGVEDEYCADTRIFVLVGANRLWSMNGRWLRRKRLRGGSNNMGLGLSLQALAIISGGIVH